MSVWSRFSFFTLVFVSFDQIRVSSARGLSFIRRRKDNKPSSELNQIQLTKGEVQSKNPRHSVKSALLRRVSTDVLIQSRD